jgi:preprotein translocase subunit SecG
MKALNIIGITTGITLIALAGIAIAATASVLIQKGSGTDIMNTTNLTTDEAIERSNNYSNVTLGNLFYSAKTLEETYNPVNETYAVMSYVYNVTLMPPNATTTGAIISATERGNFTINTLPNGLSINQGQGLIMTEDDDDQEEEKATATFVSLSHTNPNRIGSGTSIAFFSTDSIGQLAFLNNMTGIAQVDFSPEMTTVRIWEWKGGTLPSQNEGR